MNRSLSPALILQLAALLPIVACTIGLYAAPELTPRWGLGLLTYSAVALSYLAGTLGLTGRWQLLPLLAPLTAWFAQLLDMELGTVILATIALLFGIFPLYDNRYRLFGSTAALLLALSAYKIHSYGFY